MVTPFGRGQLTNNLTHEPPIENTQFRIVIIGWTRFDYTLFEKYWTHLAGICCNGWSPYWRHSVRSLCGSCGISSSVLSEYEYIPNAIANTIITEIIIRIFSLNQYLNPLCVGFILLHPLSVLSPFLDSLLKFGLASLPLSVYLS